MTEWNRDTSIDEMLDEIDGAWTRLLQVVSAASETNRTGETDPQGWSVLDHMAHVTAWERSVLYPLQGRPRHEALGLSEETYRGDIDASNQVVRAQTEGQNYEQAMAEAQRVHEALVEAVRASDIETLSRPTTELCPGDPAGERPFIDVLRGDTVEHYDEHREFIEAILGA